MKIICYAHIDHANESLTSILESEGYDVFSTNSEMALWKAVNAPQHANPVVLYHVSNDNFADCYRSLDGLSRLRPGSDNKPEVIVVADDSVQEEAVKMFTSMASSVVSMPIDVDAILAKLGKLKVCYIKSPDGAGVEDAVKFEELLEAMKTQLISIKDELATDQSIEQTNKQVLRNLQHQIGKLDKYLVHNKKLNGLKYIKPEMLMKRIFRANGWSEIDYRAHIAEPQVEVDYEYFEKALDDLLCKMMQIAGSAENMSIAEVLQGEYLVVSFAITVLDTTSTLDLLNYKNFDFCRQVVSMHAGELFIKYDGECAYITMRLPIVEMV